MSDTATPLKPWQRGGPTPNPKGRGKGTPNKFSQQLVADFAADWREHGAAAIEQLRKENVAAYVKIATSLVPRELLLQVSQAAGRAVRRRAAGRGTRRARPGHDADRAHPPARRRRADRAGPARGAGRRRRRRLATSAPRQNWPAASASAAAWSSGRASTILSRAAPPAAADRQAGGAWRVARSGS